jgi:hypothetical protein
MINLLKENDINRGLTILEYIDWCNLYNVTKIVNIKSSEDCTKEEILKYSSFLNENHKKQMKMSYHNSENDKMLKCMTCDHCKHISKDTLRLPEILEYIVTCSKENVTFIKRWNAHVSDLPCWEGRND